MLLYFANLLPEERLKDVLDQRTADIEATLDMLKEIETAPCELPVHHQFVVGLARASLAAQLTYLRDHRSTLTLTSPAAA